MALGIAGSGESMRNVQSRRPKGYYGATADTQATGMRQIASEGASPGPPRSSKSQVCWSWPAVMWGGRLRTARFAFAR